MAGRYTCTQNNGFHDKAPYFLSHEYISSPPFSQRICRKIHSRSYRVCLRCGICDAPQHPCDIQDSGMRSARWKSRGHVTSSGCAHWLACGRVTHWQGTRHICTEEEYAVYIKQFIVNATIGKYHNNLSWGWISAFSRALLKWNNYL